MLQGLCSNDLERLQKPGDAVNAAFLTSKGRIQTSASVYFNTREDSAPSVLIESHTDLSTALLDYLRLYKLRSKVKFDTPSLYTSYVSSNEDQTDLKDFEGNCDTIFIAPDLHEGSLGTRVISRKGIMYIYYHKF